MFLYQYLIIIKTVMAFILAFILAFIHVFILAFILAFILVIILAFKKIIFTLTSNLVIIIEVFIFNPTYSIPCLLVPTFKITLISLKFLSI